MGAMPLNRKVVTLRRRAAELQFLSRRTPSPADGNRLTSEAVRLLDTANEYEDFAGLFIGVEEDLRDQQKRRRRNPAGRPSFYILMKSAAVVHRGDCPHCNGGKRVPRGTPNIRAKRRPQGFWIGPFDSFSDAMARAEKGARPIKLCRHCDPSEVASDAAA
jgi:hypothetical protein